MCKNLLIALIDKIKCMYTSLMSVFGSITDQSQEYKGFLNINFIMGPYYIMMQADREHNFN